MKTAKIVVGVDKRDYTVTLAYVTVTCNDAKYARRLEAYIEAFEYAEDVVMDHKARVSQFLMNVEPPELGPKHRLYRVWVGNPWVSNTFLGACMAEDEEQAKKLMASALTEKGYPKSWKKKLRASLAVPRYPNDQKPSITL